MSLFDLSTKKSMRESKEEIRDKAKRATVGGETVSGELEKKRRKSGYQKLLQAWRKLKKSFSHNAGNSGEKSMFYFNKTRTFLLCF